MGLTEHLADHLQIPRVQLPHRPNITRQAAGFFLSLTLLPSLMVLMGDLMLADRASDGESVSPFNAIAAICAMAVLQRCPI